MDKCSVLLFLINDTNKKIDLLERYNQVVKDADRLYSDSNDWGSYYSYIQRNFGDYAPKKAQIKENLKMIRRISLEIEREMAGD